jgi:hypothetical protein
MTNLNAVLQLYFVDEDVDDAIDESIGSKSYSTSKTFIEKGMDVATFTNLFIAHNGMYGTDVVSGIHQLANRHWLSPLNGVKSRNIFNILAFATKNKLQWKNDEPICVYDDYLLWNDISRIIGEDLLTTSYLALRHLQEGLNINSFAWKPNITANNPDLTNVLKKGLGELHYHLGGSSLIFDVSWMSLMNTEKIGAEVKRNLIRLNKKLYTWIEKARAARIFLFKYNKYKGARINQLQINTILKGSSNDIKIYARDIGKEITNEKVNAYRLGSHCVDYAIDEEPTELDKKRYYNIPLIGERKLLYNLLTKIYNGDRDCALSLYIYLLVKNKFRKYLIQNDRIKGFSHFQEIQGRKENFFEGYIYEKLFLFMAMQTTICNQPLQKLEMRVSPKNSSMNLQEALRNYNLCVNDSSLRLKLPNRVRELNAKAGYVLHFIKRSDNGIDSKKVGIVSCRNYKLRKKIEDQANAIAQLVHDNSMYVKGGIQSHSYNKEKSTLLGDIKNSIHPIIGIDAASSEFGCRPEVFGPAFRRLKHVTRVNSLDSLYEKRDLQLGRTFHVGEDFYDIVDGLRAIDECISFLNFGCGDRIGHAVALGIDVYSYYKTRNFKVVMPKQVLLDNAVWLLKKMEEYSIDDKYGTKSKLNEIFEIYFNNIYEINATINDYYASWMLRGDEPSRQIDNSNYLWKPFLKNQNNPSLDFIRTNQKVMKLYQAYHFSAKAREIGDEMVEYQFDDGDARIIRDTQEKMRKKIAREKIAIETNPTSNLQITDIDRYSKHPITAFYNRGLTRDYAPDQITVSINTDDQGVFATSLEKEYTLIACALEKKRNDDGSPTYSPKDIYKWLDDIRESSLVSSFLEDDLN